MYPDFQYLFETIFKTEGPAFLSAIKTFGFFMAIAFLAGAWILKNELKRKERLGQLKPWLSVKPDAKKHSGKLLEMELVGEEIQVYPHQRTGAFVVIAVISGLIGAKLFNALETWDDFIRDPAGNLFSGGGLTFYGGLIVASLSIFLYCKKHKINFGHFCDAAAPALIIAYAIGRLGCHFSGDGDWGIFNNAYISRPDGSVGLATGNDFNQSIALHASYFSQQFGLVNQIPHTYVAAPNGFPDWLFAMNFPHNVINEGIPIEGCTGKYCAMLPIPVFPTSLYEAFICSFLFIPIWALRRKFKQALHLFGFYLILNGLERFFIEKIKVNYKYDWGFIHLAQSEIISVLLIIAGCSILVLYRRSTTSTGLIQAPIEKTIL